MCLHHLMGTVFIAFLSLDKKGTTTYVGNVLKSG